MRQLRTTKHGSGRGYTITIHDDEKMIPDPAFTGDVRIPPVAIGESHDPRWDQAAADRGDPQPGGPDVKKRWESEADYVKWAEDDAVRVYDAKFHAPPDLIVSERPIDPR
jgi:hypothetical protein